MKNRGTTISATTFDLLAGNPIICLYEARHQAQLAAAEVKRGQGEIAFWNARMALRWLATAYPDWISAAKDGGPS